MKLGIPGAKHRRSIAKDELPLPLRTLPAAKIEDILCIFKAHFPVVE